MISYIFISFFASKLARSSPGSRPWFVTTVRCVEDQLHDWDPSEVEQVMMLLGRELDEAMR